MDSLPIPTSAYLAFQALRDPDRVALIDQGQIVTYRHFACELEAIRAAATRLGLAPGALVAICCKSAFLHWLLLLAFEDLGIVTASFLDEEGATARPLHERADLVLSDSAADYPAARRVQRLAPGWIADLPDSHLPTAEAPARPVSAPDQPIRLVRSSGTAGGRKSMLRGRAAQQSKVMKAILHKGCRRQSRYFFCIGFTVESIYATATACLRVGGTCIFDAEMPIREVIAQHRPSAVYVLPLYLERLLQHLPADFEKPASLAVYSIGAPVSASLRRRILDRVATEMEDLYGANEVDTIAITGADGTGAVLPEVTVEVVGDDDRPLPLGEIGAVRIRSEGMVDGYLDDPEASARMFRQGWFYPGDLGSMTARGRLRLIGRNHDVVNIDGLKLVPQEIEAQLLRQPMILSAAVTSRRNAQEREELCLAIVADPAYRGDLRSVLSGMFPAAWTVHVRRLDAIPINPAGKVDRQAVAALFRSPVLG